LFQLNDTYLLELVSGRRELEVLISIIRVFGWVWVSGKLRLFMQAVSRRAGGGPPADPIEPPTPKDPAGALTKQPMARRYVKKVCQHWRRKPSQVLARQDLMGGANAN
jgi:hypothetical protein